MLFHDQGRLGLIPGETMDRVDEGEPGHRHDSNDNNNNGYSAEGITEEIISASGGRCVCPGGPNLFGHPAKAYNACSQAPAK
jgi:hypothetical protein